VINQKPEKTNRIDWLMLAISLSFLVHVILLILIEKAPNELPDNALQNNQVKINFIEKQTEKNTIVEVQQEETEAPENTTRKGKVNHKTDKETKIAKEKLSHIKGANAGSNELKSEKASQQNQTAEMLRDLQNIENKNTKKTLTLPESKNGIGLKKAQEPTNSNARNSYEKFLAQNYQNLAHQTEAGYQDYIDEDLEVGDAIDLNTQEYRFIGYFSGLRKSIELVWGYPREAAMRGFEGSVALRFNISKDGYASRVKVVKSSGHKVLDQAILNAVKLASPYAPLPEDFEKENLQVTGTFTYVLSSWGVAH
jgi:periplasmic protein TonB